MKTHFKKDIVLLLLRRIILLRVLAFLFLQPFISEATHISGADITYKWITGNKYQLNLTLYRDCAGIAAPNSVGVSYSSVSCGVSATVTLTRVPGTGQEISHVCSTAVTTCTTGTLPGIQKYEYIGTVTLPMACTDWVFGYSICCRNCAITTLSYSPNNCSGVPGTYVEATLNNRTVPNNSAPVFTNIPVAFLCIGQTFHYNHGAYDADGDSLVYSFVTPRSAAGTYVTFKPGFSASNPLTTSPAMTLDNSGDITITPTQTEVGVMTILVKEYRNGVLIGSVLRDMEVYTQPCNNLLPVATGVNGTSVFDIVACPGRPLSFNINSSDPNTPQSVIMTCINNIPGANFTSNNAQFPTGTFSWTPTLAQARSQPYQFIITVQDNNCPFLGYQTYSFTILVPKLNLAVGSTNATCAIPSNGSVSVTATGTSPYTYLWNPGGISTPTATGLAAGTYVCRVTDRYGCAQTVSASITAPPPITMSSTPTNVRCNGQSDGALSVATAGGVGPYSYSWSPNVSTTASATNIPAGTYQCIVTDANGCTTSTSAVVTQPTLVGSTMTPPVNVLCNGASTGSALVSARGGTAPYRYVWQPGNISGASISNLAAGTYQVTITDANNCSTTNSVTISQPPALGLSTTTQPTTCGNINGAVGALASGGVGPYTFIWTPGNLITDLCTGIPPGNYTVIATDANGCTTTTSQSVNAIAPPVSTISSFGNVSCYNGTDGTATAAVANGTGPFTYQWSPSGGSNATATNLRSGTYTVRVTDANGCTSDAMVNISQPSALISTGSATVGICGTNSGTASIFVNGGSAPYDYSWSNGETGVTTIDSLAPANYSVVVTDNNGCTISQSITVQNTGVVQPSITSTTAPNCFGSSDGTASVSVTGGTQPYSYLWSQNNSGVNTIAGLATGTYSVTVSDANGCSASASVVISSPPPMLASTLSSVDATCFGASNGQAQVSITGGVAPYSFNWVGYAYNGTTLSNKPAGTYPVIITDSHGCTVSANAIVNQPTQLSISPVSNSSTCGNSNGDIDVTVAGGIAPYTYSWPSLGSSTSQVTNLSAGNYNVIITDNNGCTASASIGVSNILGPTASMNSLTSVKCFGGSDGQAIVAVNGGTAPFAYSWSCSNVNDSIITGVPVGNYSVMITDGNNCMTAVPFSISGPTVLNSSVVTTAVSCYLGTNGQAAASVSGGTGPYTYSWSNGATTSTLTNIPAGNYSVVATDANGCTISAAAIVSQPSVVTVSATVTDAHCYNQPSGTALAAAVGGSSQYTYQWSNGQTGQLATGLLAGTYQVIATDSRGCSVSTNLTVNQPTQLIPLATSSPTTCGLSNGTVSVIANGGTAPYSYLWSPGNISSSQYAGIAPGNYSVTITDAQGCTSSTSSTVSALAPPNVQISLATNVSCYNGNDGQAVASISNGQAPFTYQWMPNVSTTAMAVNLPIGLYSVITTDANGCISSTSVNITQPSLLTSSASTTIGTCGFANGTALVIPNGGTSPYNYHWSNGETASSVISNLTPGIYSVVVSDSHGCTSSSAVSVQNTGVVTPSMSSTTAPNCFGGSDGSASVHAIGGTQPYTYSWPSSISNISTAVGLTAGTYDVTITDVNSCIATVSVVISEPPPVLLSTLASLDARCFGSNNGRAQVDVNGGTMPYRYTWTGYPDSTSFLPNRTAGTYNVLVTDAHGCSVTASAIVNQPTQLNLSSSTTSSTCGYSNGSLDVSVNGGVGPYTYAWQNSAITSSTLNNISAGNYSVIVTDNHNCTVAATIGVSNITGPTAALQNAIPVSCFGGNNGSAEVNVNGGTAPFTFDWSTPMTQNLNAINGLSAGTYSVLITDGNNCMTTVPFTITQPAQLSSTVQSVAVTCYGGNNGELSALPSGGVGPYSYYWSTAAISSTVTNLQAGNYSAIVTDANGCTVSAQAVVTQPAQLSTTSTTSPVLCNGESNGHALVQSTGGVGSYFYQWSDGQTGPLAQNLSAGTYSVVVTDDNACTFTHTLTITQPDPLNSVTEISPANCNGSSTGSILMNISGGITPYNYNWNPIATNDPYISNLAKGNYSVVVTDANGCSLTETMTVDEPLPIEISSTAHDVTCFNGSNGAIGLSITGGTVPYSFNWNTGANSADINSLLAGTYQLLLTDRNGCHATHQVVIDQPMQVEVSALNPAPICIGQSASVTAVANGGVAPYEYHWSNGLISPVQTFSPVVDANYFVYAIDSNGCQSASVPVSITVNSMLTSSLISTDTICEGDNASLIVNVNGGNGGPYIYNWSTGGTTNSISIQPTTTQTYTVSIADNCGTPPINQQTTVFVNPKPDAEFIAVPIIGCPGLSVSFRPQPNTIGVSSYYWNFGDGVIDSTLNPVHLFAAPGVYSVTHSVTSTEGCTAIWRQPAAVTIKNPPVADFEMSTDNPSIILPYVAFTDLSIDPVAWNWSFGDGIGSTLKNPQHTYKDTGIYIVQLIVSNQYMCKDTINKVVKIKDEFVIYFPNTFTPNDDNVNDRFKPLGIGVDEFKMLIFDRWGEVIYTTSDIAKGWDGTKLGTGKLCAEDTYVYLSVVTDEKGEKHEYKGHVNLVY